MYLDGAARRDEDVLYGLLLVAVLAESFLALPPLQDDVDVAGNQRGDLLACTQIKDDIEDRGSQQSQDQD